MKTKTLIIVLAIYTVFVSLAYTDLVPEELWRILLMGSLFFGSVAGGFIDGKQGIKGVAISTVVVITLNILSNIIFTMDPFFILVIFVFLFFQFVVLCGWALGYLGHKVLG